MNPYFFGVSTHRMNAKGQVAFPAQFRAVIDEEAQKQGLVLLKGEARCLYCYTHSQFREIVDRMMGDEEIRGDADFMRDFFERIHSVLFDSQGRIVVSADLREEAGLAGPEVVFLGHRDRVELWDAAVRDEERTRSRGESEDKRARLARRIFGP